LQLNQPCKCRDLLLLGFCSLMEAKVMAEGCLSGELSVSSDLGGN